MEVVQDRTPAGGAIVFDHLTGVDGFRYTLGETHCGAALVDDAPYFQLRGIGVFYRAAMSPACQHR